MIQDLKKFPIKIISFSWLMKILRDLKLEILHKSPIIVLKKNNQIFIRVWKIQLILNNLLQWVSHKNIKMNTMWFQPINNYEMIFEYNNWSKKITKWKNNFMNCEKWNMVGMARSEITLKRKYSFRIFTMMNKWRLLILKRKFWWEKLNP